jgi:REP element-mobilizing transposase RayT
MRENTDIHDVWQRNYYEVIIQNNQAYSDIADYIINNPQKWFEEDEKCRG